MRSLTLLCVVVLTLTLSACAPVRIPTIDTRTPLTPTPTLWNSAVPGLATSTPLPPKRQVLRINLGSRPDLLDPQKASTNGEVAILQMAYEGLTRLDQTGRVQPGAAATWEYSPDGKTITFHLREGLKRADGTPLTARDYEFAFKHAVDPRIGAADASFLDNVRGAVAAYSLDARSKPDDIQNALDGVGIKALDDSTLVVDFDQPAGYWPTIASTWIGYPSERSKVESDPDAWYVKPENQNGNGPFKIADMQEDYVRLVPSSNYWGGKPKLEGIEFYWISDPAAALDSYRKGEIDVTRLTSDTLAQVQFDPQLSPNLVRGPSAWVTYVGFNVKKPPFTDKAVRIAFSQALDRDGLVRDVLKGLGKAYRSWIPPQILGYDESAVVPGYDPQAAAKTLIDAGYGTPDRKRVDCNKLGVVKLSYSNTPRNQMLFQFLAGNLTRVFACQVLLDPIDASTYALLIKDSRTSPQIYMLTWQEEYPHPQNWLFLQTCNGVYALRIGYCNKAFDTALMIANQELAAENQVEQYKAAQRIFIADMAIAPLWYSENAYLVKPAVRFLWDYHSTADNAFPGQFGPLTSYAIP